MATVAQNIETLNTIKNNIKNAINNKGVTVTDGDSFTTYASKIDEIETGGAAPVLESISITENGIYTPPSGVDGYNEVNVNVETEGNSKINIQETGLRIAYSKFTEIPEWVDFEGITDMSNMFNSCSSLKTIPLINTSSVTNMQNMFNNCSKLETIPLLNTSNVTNMQSMFNICSSLETIPLLNTSNVTNMSYMFGNCASLETIPLLNTSNVTNMSFMFSYTKELKTIPQINTSNVSNMSYMFYGISSLQSLPLLDAGRVTNMNNFFGSSNITTLTDVGGFKNLKQKWNDNYGLIRLPNLTYQSCKNVLENLYDFTGNGETPTSSQAQLKVHQNFLDLVGDEISIGTNKGWIITT